MKKTISNILFAALVIATAASCQKDSDFESQAETNGSRVLVASFDQAITRTTLDDHTPKWAKDDVITLTDGTNAQNFTLVASVTDATNQGLITDGGAKFTVTVPSSWGTTIYGCYPASAFDEISEGAVAINIPSEQDGSFAKANICTASTTGNTLPFKNATALLKITTEEATKAVNIAISGASSITLTPSSAGVNYVAIPTGKPFKDFTFTAIKTATNWAAKTSSQSTVIERNKIYDLGAVGGWTYNEDGNTLWSQFTVNGDDKKVRFSKGNLWCNTSSSPVTWSFESNQYDYRHHSSATYDAAVINGAVTTTPSGTVGSFFWSKTASVAYALTWVDASRTVSDTFFADDASVMGAEWKALTGGADGEWKYLLETRTNAANLIKINVSVCGIAKCLVLAPDCFSGTIADSYTTETWSNAEAIYGLVCLPPTGWRNGSSVQNVGVGGSYWSATPSALDNAYGVYFSDSYSSDKFQTAGNYGRYGGDFVRLVRTASN